MLHNSEEYATLLWTELQQSTAANEQIYFFNPFLRKLILSNEFSLNNSATFPQELVFPITAPKSGWTNGLFFPNFFWSLIQLGRFD